MKNPKKGYITRYIRFIDENEINELLTYLDGNYKDEAISMLIKIIKRGDFAF